MPERLLTPASARRRVLAVVMVYAVVAGLWIWLSDAALAALVSDPGWMTTLSMYKGWAFVGVTTVLLYGVVQQLVSEILHATRARLDSLGLLEAVVNSSSDAIYAKDLQGRYLLFNRESERLTGKTAAQVLGQDDHLLFPPEQAAAILSRDQHILDQDQRCSFEEQLATTQGLLTFLSTKGVLRDAQGGVTGVFGISRNITELKQAEVQLRLLSEVVEQSPTSILITDLEGRIEYVNRAFERNTQYSLDEVRGKTPGVLSSGQTPPAVFQALWQAVVQGQVWQGEILNRRKDGSCYRDAITLAPVRNETGQITHYLSVQQDITAQRAAEEKAHSLAWFDPLTGLANRERLLLQLDDKLASHHRTGHQAALVLLNVDRFKTVNDGLGHKAGDELLVALAARLSPRVRPGDTLARLGGDEFALLLPGLSSQATEATAEVLHLCQDLHASLEAPFTLSRDELSLTLSLAVTLFPDGGADTPGEVLRRANTALHRAKAAGGHQTAFFDQAMGEAARQRFAIERDLRRGIAAGELRLFLQPQVDRLGRMVAAEALVRWQHPERGLLPPGLFIAVAEESDLIVDLGLWMLQAVCQTLAQLAAEGRPLTIAVNISPRQFHLPQFVQQVQQQLLDAGAAGQHLTLEVTEGVVIEDIHTVVAKMNELAALGVQFSIDDFGTGYSSLAYLKQLPLHELKIDKGFVQDAPDDPNDAALVEAMLSVARHLGLQVVAEGVETQAQADFLNARGQVTHQGYLFGKPAPADVWLAHWHSLGKR